VQKRVPEVEPINPAHYPDALNLARLMRDMRLPRGDLVTVTFSNSKMAALTMNWALHLRKAGVPHVVGALDAPMLAALRKLGAPTAAYDLFFSNLDGGSSHASDSWKSFAKLRIGQVRALLEMGYDVLMSDVDVVWRRDPRTFLQCGYNHVHLGGLPLDSGRQLSASQPISSGGGAGGDGAGGSEERWDGAARGGGDEEQGGEDSAAQLKYLRVHGGGSDDCMGISAAEVMVSSDNLSPRHDQDEGAMYARRGVFNTGIVFLKHTKGAKKFAEAWNAHLNAKEGRYARLTSDQQVFNAMAREEGQWPGLSPHVLPAGFPTTRVLVANGLLDGSTFRLGILPVALFNPGHVYFLQREKLLQTMPGAEPYGVHATYTFDGSSGAAKRLRFAEVGLWDPAADKAAADAEMSGGAGGGGGDGKSGDRGGSGGESTSVAGSSERDEETGDDLGRKTVGEIVVPTPRLSLNPKP
jgi:hypothetical protein